jgi:hypothetical protein
MNTDHDIRFTKYLRSYRIVFANIWVGCYCCTEYEGTGCRCGCVIRTPNITLVQSVNAALGLRLAMWCYTHIWNFLGCSRGGLL